MTKRNNGAGEASDNLLRIMESKDNSSGLSMVHKNNNPMRELRRSKERAALKDQVRSAKAIQIKSTRGFA